MARRVSWGIPGGPDRKSEHYLFPQGPYRRLLLGTLLIAVCAAALFGFELLGRFAGMPRQALMPGALLAAHSTIHSCESCHAPARGVANFRCQRCHDEAGPGRLTQTAHVGRHFARLGALDQAQKAQAQNLECVRCHIDHRGAKSALRPEGDAVCIPCHGQGRPGPDGPRPDIDDFGDHPEFRALVAAAAARPEAPLRQATGLLFSHVEHVKQGQKDLAKRGVAMAPGKLCAECHRVAGATRDFEALRMETHCLRCHQVDLKMEPVAQGQLIQAASLDPVSCGEDVTCTGGNALKAALPHADAWLLRNVRKLRRELFPEAHARDYASTLARVAQLRRRLFLAQPLATLAVDKLQERREAFNKDIATLDQRLQARAQRPTDGTGGLARLDEVLAAAAAGGEAEAAALRAEVEALKKQPPAGAALGDAAFQQRREELLQLLDAVAASASASGEQKSRAAFLRLRLLAVLPGEGAREGLQRAVEQRREGLQRLDDELSLRASGIVPGQPGPGLRAVEKSLEEALNRLRELRELETLPVASAAERPAKEQALAALVGQTHESGCAKCHEVKEGTFAPVSVARPVLTLSVFAHEPHLRAGVPAGAAPAPADSVADASCTFCHGAVEKSGQAAELHLKSIASCRECHRSGGQRQDCLLCHRYHPPAPR